MWKVVFPYLWNTTFIPPFVLFQYATNRDLYGTVVNEGATKGILVTTADYGPDSYQFAKDKPLTLLSGSNLLHLLEKHGHHAKIDIREAKKILAEQEKNR